MSYFKIIENYQPQNIEVPATQSITILTLGTSLLTINIAGPDGPFTFSTASTGNILTTINNLLNQFVSAVPINYTIISLGDPALPTTPIQIIFVAKTGLGLQGNLLQVGFTNGLTGTPSTFSLHGLINLQGGLNPLNDESNTITEEQLQFNVLPAISQLLSVSLPQPGSITSTTPILNTDILVESGDNITLETTDPLLTEN